MKKTIELNLSLNDPFFVELKEKVLQMNGVGGFEDYIQSIISPVMNATLNTLKDLSSQQKQSNSKVTKFSYDYKENVYPEFHNILDNNIDTALNRRIHTTTLERITDIIEDFISEYADRQKNQHKIKLNTYIDSDKELTAITNYISTTWNGFKESDSADFFKKVWDLSNSSLKNQFDNYIFLDFVKDFYSLTDLPNTKVNGMSIANLPMYLLISVSNLQNSVQQEWNYQKNVNSIMFEAKELFPYVSKAKPKNWNNMAKNYSDYDGMSELDSKSLKELFGGMDSGTAGSYSFEVRTSLPHVIYDDKCQGRKPLEVLVGAIVGHAYVMNEKNNAKKMLNEWIELKEKIENSSEKEISFEFKEPLNQALFNIMKNKGTVTPESLEILGIKSKKKKLNF